MFLRTATCTDCNRITRRLPFPLLTLLVLPTAQRPFLCQRLPCSPWLLACLNKQRCSVRTGLIAYSLSELTLVLVNVDLILNCCKSRPSRGSIVPWCGTRGRPDSGSVQPWIPLMRTSSHRRWSRFERSMRTRQCPTVEGDGEEREGRKNFNPNVLIPCGIRVLTNDGSSPKKNGLSASSSERVLRSSFPSSIISSGLWTPMPWALTIFEA